MSRLLISSIAIVATLVALTPASALADQGTVVKWSNPLGPPVVGTAVDPGENIGSDLDWRFADPNLPVFAPNWVVAEDFRSDGRPILTVRWWGSYFDPANEPQQDAANPNAGFVPVIEEGFLLSFFSDIPAVVGGPPSEPGSLLGSYIAPIGAVRIQPTGIVGWDMHHIWEYEVNLQDTHLDHPSSLANQISFNEQAGDIYWLSIAAENGHEIQPDWSSQPTTDPVEQQHWWGWHTTTEAQEVIDLPVMGSLFMLPNPNGVTLDWVYDFNQPVQPIHLGKNMAFELLTVPEPSSLLLAGFAALFVGGYGWRRRKLTA